MSDILISKEQLNRLQEIVSKQTNLDLAKENWSKFNEEERNFVISFVDTIYPKDSKVIKEAWYNTVMDILGVLDPTPVVDIINATSYFLQGNTLYGILTMVGAIPYAGDIVAKPVLGALKIGSKSTKTLESALKLSKNAAVGSKEYVAAEKAITGLAKEPGVIGTFLQKMGGGLGDKIIKTIDEIPAGPFKGMKDTIKSYFQLLSNAGKKSVRFQGTAKLLAADFKAGKAAAADVKALKDLLKGEKIFDVATLSKPGFFTNVFFGGIPRLFRSPQGRRMRILMQSTKWWLGFLDYIGIGNWVGPDEIVKQMGESKFNSKVDEYQRTPQAKKYFEEQFGQENMETTTEPQQQTTTQQTNNNPFSDFLRNLFLGKINPLPGS